MLLTLNNRWNWMPLWSPAGEGAGGGDDAPGDAAAVGVATGVADDANAGKPDAGSKAGDPPPAEGDAPAAGDNADEAAAARKAELDAMTPEDRAKAEADDAAAAEAEAKLDAIPEDGKYALTMPEGVEVDQALLDALGPEFKDLALSNRDAQRLADKFIEIETAKRAKQAEDWAGTVAKWADDAKKDTEIGGPKWDASVSSAGRALDRFGSPALTEYLDATGAGNHPELIRLLAKVGAAIGEDEPAISENPRGGPKPDTAAVLYPNDTPKGK